MAVQHRNRLLPVATLATAVLMLTANWVVVEANRKGASNQGKLEAVDLVLYWDSVCANKTVAVDWGPFSPGASSSVTLYVRNEGDSAVKLNLTTCNWNPADASELITLTWDREGQIIEPQTVAAATLSLSVLQALAESRVSVSTPSSQAHDKP